MIVVLSPSKSMDMNPAFVQAPSQPDFLDKSETLIATLRRYSKADLMEFMQISETLAELNLQRFKEWNPPFTAENAKVAILAFTGDVYDGLDAASLKQEELNFAQSHLRILSGLYGLLRPMDLIQPYRLEMGRKLEIMETKNLYGFWKETISETLNSLDGNLLINLASDEYFKAIDKRKLNKEIVTPIFKDEKNGSFKVISFYAKKARGYMARYIIENQITAAEHILKFNANGYAYNPELSSPSEPVFTRENVHA